MSEIVLVRSKIPGAELLSFLDPALRDRIRQITETLLLGADESLS